ncbi:hypothetical protein C8J30_101376 [Rhodobacter viridis]|uniref:Uncharacterized protein n=1 Tax=Rhodobacter viridis TaxID=1054202 RepID=A0A318UAM9_9RHOB|nr:hypothetical protein [Rhodobacter viridis]PYF12991.1 hypothetical protein C8J30_101376 [Rhodobacter viridis]
MHDDDAGAGQTGPARRGLEIDHEDVPPTMTEAWIQRPALPAWQTSADWHLDDPEALLAAGPVAVGSALARLVEWGGLSADREVREVAALISEWLTEDLGQHDFLDFHLGLRPRDGRRPLAFEAKIAERNALVLSLSREAPYREMTASAAAKALRAACARYESTRWPEDRKDRKTRPGGEAETWWLVMKLGLHHPMPGADTLAERIRQDRKGQEPQASFSF